MKTKIILCLCSLCVLLASCTQSVVIKTEIPARQAGQEHVLNLSVAPIDTVRVGMIGLGMRGIEAVRRFPHIPGVEISAICDLREECIEKAQKIMAKFNLPKANEYKGEEGWKELCQQEDLDLIYICTDWLSHTPIALYAMDCGKHVAIEVPAALNMEEIWALIDKAEQSRLHCMMLENCIYDFFELTSLEMAQKGVFGELIHAEGAYIHNLDPFWEKYWNNWRLAYNQDHRGDVYPTHGIGPICLALNIHRGDRMKTLVSMDTKPLNGKKIMEKVSGKACESFVNADQTNTLIQTELGKTMLIEHNVLTPRPYSRMYQLVGTDGFANKYPTKQYCLREEVKGEINAREILEEKVYMNEELKALQAEYTSPILTEELEKSAKEVGGHGGMDFIMDYRLIYCLQHGLPLDMDVYDLAEWCCLAPLTKLSLENDNRPVEIPDFTRGAWNVVEGYKFAVSK